MVDEHNVKVYLNEEIFPAILHISFDQIKGNGFIDSLIYDSDSSENFKDGQLKITRLIGDEYVVLYDSLIHFYSIRFNVDAKDLITYIRGYFKRVE